MQKRTIGQAIPLAPAMYIFTINELYDIARVNMFTATINISYSN